MKRGAFWGFALVLLVLAVWVAPARAIVIGFDPAAQSVAPGASANVGLTISDLGDFAPPSLSTFDVDVSFDASVIGFTGATLGDPVLGDQLDLFGLGSITDVIPGAGTINLFELSFDLPGDLDTLQAGAFTLATLTFDALTVGTSPLNITINALGDSLGDPLGVTVAGGSITVAQASTPIPEPSTFALVLLGLVGIGFMGRRRISGG